MSEEGKGDALACEPARLIGWTDFFQETAANWRAFACAPARPPDYESRWGSAYWDTGDGVYRQSDHWDLDIHHCDWLLDGQVNKNLSVGYCAYADFRPSTYGGEGQEQGSGRE